MSRSCTYPTRTCSISATPPPAAVELTFQMVRPVSMCRTRAAAWVSSAYRREPMTGSSRGTGSRGTSTVCNRLTASAFPVATGRTTGQGRTVPLRDSARAIRVNHGHSSTIKHAPHAAPRESVSDGGAVPLAGPDAQRAVYRGDPYLPVADRLRPGVLGDGLDQGFHVVIEGGDVQPDLGQQRHPGRACLVGELAELPAETADLGHGQAVHLVVDQGADQLLEPVGPDDGCDQFHAS